MQVAACHAVIGEGAQKPWYVLPVHVISAAVVRYPGRVPNRADKTRKLTMTINKLWILPGMAVVIGVFMLGWMIGSGRAPMQQSQGLDRPETQPITAAGNQADIKRDGRAPAAAVSVETPADSIARQESRQLPAGGARNSLVGMERRLTSAATDDLEAIFLAAHNYRALPPPAASQTRKAASGVIARQHAATGLTDNPQETMAVALDSTPSPALRKPDKNASGTTSFPAPATVNASDEGSTPPTPSHTTTSTAMAMQHQEAVTEQPPAVTASNKGPWVINLVSTPSKADADRMTGKALSRGIQTEQQEATVKGKQYWRVQITGFATEEDARNYSETVRQKLGLKAVWIKKR